MTPPHNSLTRDAAKHLAIATLLTTACALDPPSSSAEPPEPRLRIMSSITRVDATRSREQDLPDSVTQALPKERTQTGENAPTMKAQQLLSQVESAARRGSLDDLAKVAKFAESQWKPASDSEFFKVMLEICSQLQSMTSVNLDKQHELLQTSAMRVFAHEPKAPIDLEMALIHLLLAETHYTMALDGDALASSRKTNARLVLQLWRRFQTLIDPMFDSSDLPMTNVAPPKGATVSAGAEPEAIQDPALRAEYKRAIDENRRKAQHYNEQTRLHRSWAMFAPKAREYLVKAYSAGSHMTEELQKLLQEFEVKPEPRQAIMKSLEERIRDK